MAVISFRMGEKVAGRNN